MDPKDEQLTEDAKKGKPGAMEKLKDDLTKKLEESKGLTEKAEELRKKADGIDDSEEAGELRQQAEKLEKKSKKLIRVAQRMQKGVYQGGAAGAGIGAGVGGGLGTLVGTIVGTIASIPTTGLGLLIGAGTGAIHGPWVKLVGDTMKEEDEAEKKGEELAPFNKESTEDGTKSEVEGKHFKALDPESLVFKKHAPKSEQEQQKPEDSEAEKLKQQEPKEES